MTPKFEATAILAGYAAETCDSTIYETAADLASGTRTDTDRALEEAIEATRQHPRLTLEQWITQPGAAAHIEHRVALQETFATYSRLARRAASPILGILTVAPLHRRHIGSQAVAYEIDDSNGQPALLKVPRKAPLGQPKSEALTPGGRVSFAEQRLRSLPGLPGVNFEQLHALSYTGAVVTSRIPGKPLCKLNSVELTQVTDDHLRKAISDISALAMQGVHHDCNGSNTHFSAEHGFGFFDPLAAGMSYQWSLSSGIKGFAKNLGEIDHYSKKHLQTPHVRQQRIELFERLRLAAPEISGAAALILDSVKLYEFE